MNAHETTLLLRPCLKPSALAKKLSTLVGAALCLSACGGGDGPFYAYQDPSEAPAAVSASARAVVRIATQGGYATGSFISADGTLLTNNHVLGVDVCPRAGCFAKLAFFYERGQPFKAPVPVFVQPLHVDVGLDMAAVQVFLLDASGKPSAKFTTSNHLSFAKHDAASLIGAHVNAVGHPHGALKKWSEGDVVDEDGLWFRDTATSLPGNSGSPMLDDGGRIVGLLHRSPRDSGLITSDGANLYSIGSASAPIVAALQDPLPATVVALDAKATPDEVVARQAIYLNAHVATAVLDTGMTEDVITLLGDACDKGLGREDYVSPEDLSAGLEPCYDSLYWISCASDKAPGSFTVCPADADKASWRMRYESAFEKQRAFNGDLWLDMVSFAPSALETSRDAGTMAGETALNSALAEAHPPMDFSLALYLGAFGINSYGGANVGDFVLNYKQAPYYELSITNIVYAALWLESRHAISTDAVSSLLSDLADDDKLDLNDQLLIESKRYERGEIQ